MFLRLHTSECQQSLCVWLMGGLNWACERYCSGLNNNSTHTHTQPSTAPPPPTKGIPAQAFTAKQPQLVAANYPQNTLENSSVSFRHHPPPTHTPPPRHVHVPQIIYASSLITAD